jgi:hypothetical protein
MASGITRNIRTDTVCDLYSNIGTPWLVAPLLLWILLRDLGIETTAVEES